MQLLGFVLMIVAVRRLQPFLDRDGKGTLLRLTTVSFAVQAAVIAAGLLLNAAGPNTPLRGFVDFIMTGLLLFCMRFFYNHLRPECAAIMDILSGFFCCCVPKQKRRECSASCCRNIERGAIALCSACPAPPAVVAECAQRMVAAASGRGKGNSGPATPAESNAIASDNPGFVGMEVNPMAAGADKSSKSTL
jgi:hypothetical protein